MVEPLLEKLEARAKKLRLGSGLDESVDVGPLINSGAVEKVESYIEIGRSEGELVLGGSTATEGDLEHGNFFSPTIFAGVMPMDRIAQEEIFGPVLSVIPVDDYQGAVTALNQTKYGLSSSIFTSDANTAFRAMRDFETGIVYVNAGTTGAETHLPFGGWKETGNGHREAGHAALDSFTEWKSIYVDFSGRLQRAQIDNQEQSIELTPSAPVRRYVAIARTQAGCMDRSPAAIDVAVDRRSGCPAQPGGDFDFRPVTVEGVLQVDSEANGLFIRMPDGREYDIGFPDGYRVITSRSLGMSFAGSSRTTTR